MSTFYDIHCHIMDLSHPNIKAFLERKDIKNKIKLIFSFTSTLGFIIGPIISMIAGNKYFKILNLLYYMDNTIDESLRQFYALDIKDLFKTFKIGSERYDKIILTPLMMDFGIWEESKTDQNIFYKKIPKQHNKIRNQTIDLFNGLADFYNLEQDIKKKIEIYPFLGINTKNYDLKNSKEYDKSRSSFEDILDKYFKEMPENNRRKFLYNNMGKFDGNIKTMKSGFFAGIKLYPPLGFDPWPAFDKDYNKKEERDYEQKKVEYLYKFASENKIPLAIHCGGSGYNIMDKKKEREYTSPDRWIEVIKNFPDLKINLAHFGSKEKKWRDKIFKLICEPNNVYTDISYLCCDDKDYRKFNNNLLSLIKKYDKDNYKEKILFGTDFMINLMRMESYSKYLKNFRDTKKINFCNLNEFKNLICSKNPEKFLGF